MTLAVLQPGVRGEYRHHTRTTRKPGFFSTMAATSATEVILMGYQQHGMDGLEQRR